LTRKKAIWPQPKATQKRRRLTSLFGRRRRQRRYNVACLLGEDEILLKSRFISTSNPNYPWDALYIFAENSMVNEHNQTMLNSLSAPIVNVNACDEYPDGISHSSIAKIREKKLSDTGGLLYNLLSCGDIESNPGPFTIIKSVQGSFHQGDPKLGRNVGTQCVCNSLFAIVWYISIWNTGDLNLVLYEGT